MGCPPRVVRGSALQASIASGVNQTVRLPRARRPASYSAQLVTRCSCFGMWRRHAALALNGTAGSKRQGRGRRPTPPSSRRQPADPCNKVGHHDDSARERRDDRRGTARREQRTKALLKRCRISLRAVTAAAHYAEPQQGTTKKNQTGRLRDGGGDGSGYIECNRVSADSVVIGSRAEREDGIGAIKALGNAFSAQTSRSEGYAGNHLAISSREFAKINSKRAGARTSGRTEEAKGDLILRRRHG